MSQKFLLARLLPAISVVCLTAFGLSACGSDQRESNTTEQEIAAKAQSWQQRAITDYTLVYREFCFCPGGEITVVVRDGQIDRATRETRNGRTEPVSNPQTIDGLFATILRAQREADELTVRFDEDFDYPDSFTIDWFRSAVDDEYGVSVLRLTQQ